MDTRQKKDVSEPIRVVVSPMRASPIVAASPTLPSLADIIKEQMTERTHAQTHVEPRREEVRYAREEPVRMTRGNDRGSTTSHFQSQSFRGRPMEAHPSQRRPLGSIMTPADKDLVKRILVAQVQTENPYIDDFYCHSYRTHSGAGQSVLPGPNTKRKGMKESELVFENTLGKIPLPSVRNPRRILQLEDHRDNASASQSTLFHRYPMAVVRAIESIFQSVTEMEDIEKQLLVATPEMHSTLKSRQTELSVHMYHQILMNMGPGEVTSPAHRDRFLLHFLQSDKGKKAIKRALPLLSVEHTEDVLLWLFRHMESLDACRAAKNTDITFFLLTVGDAVRQFLMEHPSLSFLSALLRAYLEGLSGEGRLRLFASPVAVSLLSDLFDCAAREMLQPDQVGQDVADALQQWQAVFDEFISTHHGTFVYLFSNAAMHTVWIMLASVAAMATYNHKVALVTELRDMLMQSALEYKRVPHEGVSVNTFLNALGLDADQLIPG
jgi:DNA topoisomerase 2-associated protein PAT1